MSHNRSRRDRISPYELDNLGTDHEFAQRKKKVTKVEAEPVVNAPEAPVINPEDMPVAPTFRIQLKPAQAPQPNTRRSGNLKKGARELSKLYGLPMECFLDNVDQETQQQTTKRSREDAAAEQKEQAPKIEDQGVKKPKEDSKNNAEQEQLQQVEALTFPEFELDEINLDFGVMPPLAFDPELDGQFSPAKHESPEFIISATNPIPPALMIPDFQPASAQQTEMKSVKSFQEFLDEEMLAVVSMPIYRPEFTADDLDISEDEVEINAEGELKFVRKKNALQQKNTEMLRNGSIAELLDRDYPLDPTVRTTFYPLHDAVRSGDIRNVKAILEMQGNALSVLKTDGNGETALQLAAKLGLTDIEALLKTADQHVILDIMTETEKKAALNPDVSDIDVNTVSADKPSPAAVTMQGHSMFTRARKTKNSSKMAEPAQNDDLLAVQQGLEKAAELQQAAQEELKNAMEKLKEVQTQTLRRSGRKIK